LGHSYIKDLVDAAVHFEQGRLIKCDIKLEPIITWKNVQNEPISEKIVRG
jgi:hypothetical protein